ATVEQFCGQVALQPGDAPHHRGVIDPEILGGAGHRAAPGDRQHIAEVVPVNIEIPFRHFCTIVARFYGVDYGEMQEQREARSIWEDVMRTIGHFIGGKHVEGKSGRFADIYLPMTGEVQAKVALASKAELRAAVENAKAAQPAWAATNPQRRVRVLMKFLEL